MKNIKCMQCIKESKRVNLFRLFLVGLILFSGQLSFAQIRGGRLFPSATPSGPTFSFADPQEYEIGGIEVTGSQFYDGNSMINISGLQVGDKI
jgi:outer membrane protein insertion porin family